MADFAPCGLGKNQTQLMLPGTENWLVGTNSFTMLRVPIDQKLDRLSENWDIAMRKIGFLWSFALSIYMYTV